MQRYRDEGASGVLQRDPVQERVMAVLERVHGDLVRAPARPAPLPDSAPAPTQLLLKTARGVCLRCPS